MPDFTYLAKLDATEESEAEYVFDDLWGEPSIFFRPMIEGNRDFTNERMRLAMERAESDSKIPRQDRRRTLLSPDRLADDRDLDLILMARTCALRWGRAPRDTEGNEVEFSPDNCLAFLRAIPKHLVDPARGWVANPHNFVDREAARPAWATTEGADALGN